MRRAYTPYPLRHGSASIADLHRQLGEAVERLPADAKPRDRPNMGCHFEDIPPCRYVDMSAVDRLQDWASDHLASLSPERREQLNREWAEPVDGISSRIRGVGNGE